MRRRLRLLPAVWLLALLLAPTIAWLAGERQPNLTNEPKAEFPAVNRSSLRDEGTFRRFDRAILDRLPFRKEALELHARIKIDGLRVSPTPEVGIAGGGWRYYRGDLTPCLAENAAALNQQALSSIEMLARALVAGGYRSTVTIVAGKPFVHEDGAYSFDEGAEACMRELRDSVYTLLESLPGGFVFDHDLRRHEARGAATFLTTDTHWNWRGRLAVTRRLLDRVRPGLTREVVPRVGHRYDRLSDLNHMTGQPDRRERDLTVGITRLPRQPPRPGTIAMVGDSQLELVLHSAGGESMPVAQALPGQTLTCTWALECEEALARADTVVFEKVLRDLHAVSPQCVKVVAIAAARARGERGRFTELDGAAIDGGGRGLDLPDGAPRNVRVALPPAGDDTRELRLLKFPVEQLGATPDGTPPQVVSTPTGAGSCSTTTVDSAGRALVYGVPRGAPVNGLSLALTAPPGTRLGPPEVIALDGTSKRAR